MDYPQHSLYEVLYARYLAPGRTGQLLDHCGSLDGRAVLDLCGGGGRASLEALRRGARHVTLVDESIPMSAHLAGEPGLHLYHSAVDHALMSRLPGGPFDAVVCQQAINYWFDATLMPLLALHLAPGGRFVFNTFWDAPAFMPSPKQYTHEGRQYLELSWRSDARTIEHVQVCEGLAPHTTRFQWVSPEEFEAALAPLFNVVEHREGKTSVYVCTLR